MAWQSIRSRNLACPSIAISLLGRNSSPSTSNSHRNLRPKATTVICRRSIKGRKAALLPSQLQKVKHLCFRDMNIRQADAAAMPEISLPGRHAAASSLPHALIRSRRRTPSLELAPVSASRLGFFRPCLVLYK